jgi:beta-galactosidase/beta-glucuronidase
MLIFSTLKPNSMTSAEEMTYSERFASQKASFRMNLPNPHLWSAEAPHTYVFIYIQQPGSTADTKLEVEACRVGLQESSNWWKTQHSSSE